MVDAELARTVPTLPPGRNEFATAREFDDARIGVSAMTVAHDDVPVGGNRHIRRSVEHIRPVPGYTRLADRQQDLALGTELENLVALAVPARIVRSPDI